MIACLFPTSLSKVHWLRYYRIWFLHFLKINHFRTNRTLLSRPCVQELCRAFEAQEYQCLCSLLAWFSGLLQFLPFCCLFIKDFHSSWTSCMNISSWRMLQSLLVAVWLHSLQWFSLNCLMLTFSPRWTLWGIERTLKSMPVNILCSIYLIVIFSV